VRLLRYRVIERASGLDFDQFGPALKGSQVFPAKSQETGAQESFAAPR
jgi:hypothetical protein